jgi:hypothetical protein
MMARALLTPGEGALFATHEQEVWSIRGGDGAVVTELLVEVSAPPPPFTP